MPFTWLNRALKRSTKLPLDKLEPLDVLSSVGGQDHFGIQVGARWVQDSNELLESQCGHQSRDQTLHPSVVELSIVQLIAVGVRPGNRHSLLTQLSPHALFTLQVRARPMVSVPQTHPALYSSCLADPVLDDYVEHLSSRAVHLEGVRGNLEDQPQQIFVDMLVPSHALQGQALSAGSLVLSFLHEVETGNSTGLTQLHYEVLYQGGLWPCQLLRAQFLRVEVSDHGLAPDSSCTQSASSGGLRTSLGHMPSTK